MTKIIDNITFLRFDYPYNKSFLYQNTIIEYDKMYKALKDKNIRNIKIYYKPDKNSTSKKPYIVVDTNNIAKIDEIKYNKIIGSFNLDNLIELFNQQNPQGERKIILNDIINKFKSRKCDENCYYAPRYNYGKTCFYDLDDTVLIVNLTNKNLRNFIL